MHKPTICLRLIYYLELDAFFASRISAEAHVFLRIQYSSMLDRLWQSDEVLSQFLPLKGNVLTSISSKSDKNESHVVQHRVAETARCKSSCTREKIRDLIEKRGKATKVRVHTMLYYNDHYSSD